MKINFNLNKLNQFCRCGGGRNVKGTGECTYSYFCLKCGKIVQIRFSIEQSTSWAGHTYMDEEAASITKCCHTYMDEVNGQAVCRGCGGSQTRKIEYVPNLKK